MNRQDIISKNYIYFYHLDTFCILPLYPDSINDSLSVNFYETNALSRTAPVFTYANSGPRTVTISLNLYRDMFNDLMFVSGDNVKAPVAEENEYKDNDYMDTLINYLQAASLPKYSTQQLSSKTVEPPMVAVRFGDNIFIKGVITGSIAVDYHKPIIKVQVAKDSYKYKYANATVSFSVKEMDPYSADDVKDLGSFRDITAGKTLTVQSANHHNTKL